MPASYLGSAFLWTLYHTASTITKTFHDNTCRMTLCMTSCTGT